MNAPSDDTPTRIGERYRLEERIGAGAMGAVWRATDELLNRTVAVKQLLAAAIPAGGEALEESRQRILREGRIGARLQHAHVISMFDVVVHEDSPWLVMEYLPSQSLAQALAAKGPFEPREVADIGRQVADGLAAAHLAGVVHRDVKPGNVLLGEDGRVKLTDFGVSRATDDVQLTRTGLIAGTPAFLSPEVARGHEPTAASDVFALGATLYAAVEGHPPFGVDDNAYALLHKVATGVVEPPQQAGPLTGVIMHLLSTEPADRPSAAQARDALAAVALGASAPAGQPRSTAVITAAAPAGIGAGPATLSDMPRRPPAAPPARPRRSGRLPMLIAVLALLLASVGVAVVLILDPFGTRSNTGNQATPATSSVATASDEPDPAGAPATATPSPTTTSEPAPSTTAAAPTTETTQPPPPAGGDPVAFVRNYYALLPGNTDAAFAQLSPRAQGDSGGRGGFDRFYADMESVTLQNPRLVGDDTVDATVVFRKRNGEVSNEPYRFVVGPGPDGQLIMQSFDQR